MEKKKMNRLGNYTQDKSDKSSSGKSGFTNKQKNDFPFIFFFLPSDLYERCNDSHVEVVVEFLFIESRRLKDRSRCRRRGTKTLLLQSHSAWNNPNQTFCELPKKKKA